MILAAPGVASEPVYLTVKAVKAESSRCTAPPQLDVTMCGDRWHERKGDTWSGENDREIFFTLMGDGADTPPRIRLICPGVKVSRVIVGHTDVQFIEGAGRLEFDAVLDRSNGMLINNSLPDPIGGGLPIGLYHNWRMRADPDGEGRVRGCGPYNGRPYPEAETRAVSNYLLAAREALRRMGGMGPQDRRAFDGNIVLLGFEVACGRGHNDWPPHVHIMLYVPGYIPGSQVTHLYMDDCGRVVSNGFVELGVNGSKRNGQYRPGDVCQLRDIKGNLGIECIITKEGGIILRKAAGADEYLLSGDEQEGPARKVWVTLRGQRLACCSAIDDASIGDMSASVEWFENGRPTRVDRQAMRYDPFTAKVLTGGK